ncbi:hypothetical protein [Olleya sp. YS]|uniref:hypothetical protein n=1 Tax=Olleya sp. YS TaxID=3028318 RepID=UPI0024344CF4|nr:hypothetical protein [Olleya sp. YS]WGD36036.1 hypothetical protein Ollyesu_06365 [Olleya sp. YS]
MKKVLLLVFILVSSLSFAQKSVFELKPSQSMSITGKGSGQDAAINPYSASDCIAVIKNIGKNKFTIRIQKKGEIIKTIIILPKSTKKIVLKKEEELYLDSILKSKADVTFEKDENSYL